LLPQGFLVMLPPQLRHHRLQLLRRRQQRLQHIQFAGRQFNQQAIAPVVLG